MEIYKPYQFSEAVMESSQSKVSKFLCGLFLRGLHTGSNQRWKKLFVGLFNEKKVKFLYYKMVQVFQRWFEHVWIGL